MAAVMENVKLFNSLIRTLLFAAILGGLGFAGWTGYNRYVLPAQQAKEAMAQLDAMQTKFEDQYIEQADALRSASLCVFKSIWGDLDGPNGSQSLDRINDTSSPIAPGVYSTHEKANPFEAKIWTDFWTVSNSPEKQKELGIRASHGQVNYMLVETGQVYQVDLRSSGGISLKPIDKPAAN